MAGIRNAGSSVIEQLIELTLPNNHRIEANKQIIEEANNTIEDLTKQNETISGELDQYTTETDKEIKKLNSRIDSVINFKNDIVPVAKKHVNVLEKNKSIDFDIAKITSSCRDIVESAKERKKEIHQQIADYKDQISDNEKRIAEANQSIEDAKQQLYLEDRYRESTQSLIDKSVEENGGSLAKDRIIKELKGNYGDLFSDDQLELLCKALQYPKEGLVQALEAFEGQSKSTTDMVREAMENSQNETTTKSNQWDTTRRIIEDLTKMSNSSSSKTAKVVMTEPISKVESDDKEVKNEKQEDIEPEKELNVKKHEETKKEDNNAYIKELLGVTDEDIKYNSKIKDFSRSQIEEMISKLKDAEIDPASVNLSTYCGDFEQFLDNVAGIRRSGYMLDDRTITRSPFIHKIPNDRLLRDIAVVNRFGYSLVKKNGTLALVVLTRPADKLFSVNSLMTEIDPDYLAHKPENMAKKVADIAGRMYYCLVNGIDFKEDDYRLVENPQEFAHYYGEGIDSSFIPSTKECNQAILDRVNSPEVIKVLMEKYRSGAFLDSANLTSATIGRFNEICAHFQDINESENRNVIQVEGSKFPAMRVYAGIREIISRNIEATDQDIMLAALMYGSHNTPAKVGEIGARLDPNFVRVAA